MQNFAEFDHNCTPILVWHVPTDDDDMVGLIERVVTQYSRVACHASDQDYAHGYQHKVVESAVDNCVISYLVWRKSVNQEENLSITDDSSVLQTTRYLVWTEPGQVIRFCTKQEANGQFEDQKPLGVAKRKVNICSIKMNNFCQR